MVFAIILKGHLGMRHVQFCQFDNLIYMKLYSLLILAKKTKKWKNNFKAPKKSEITIYFQVVYCHVNKTSQQYTGLYTTYSHVLDGEIKAIAANWPLIGVF